MCVFGKARGDVRGEAGEERDRTDADQEQDAKECLRGDDKGEWRAGKIKIHVSSIDRYLSKVNRRSALDGTDAYGATPSNSRDVRQHRACAWGTGKLPGYPRAQCGSVRGRSLWRVSAGIRV